MDTRETVSIRIQKGSPAPYEKTSSFSIGLHELPRLPRFHVLFGRNFLGGDGVWRVAGSNGCDAI
jgi:hypothetical protein